MKNTTLKSIVTLLFLLLLSIIDAQQLLSKEDAIKQVLENNIGIKMMNNQMRVAQNNASILNSRFLPTLTGLAGTNYAIENLNATLQDGTNRQVNDAETTRYNASLNLNFILFDGLGRRYNYKTLKEQYNISALEAQETIELTLLQLFSVYYEVARLTENLSVYEQTFENTKERLKRAQYQFEYGQVTRLEVLNAEVDVTSDSIEVLSAKQSLENAKRDLNLILNRDLETFYTVDTLVAFISPFELDIYIEEAPKHNLQLLKASKNITISEFQNRASRGQFLPTLGLNGSYGWNEGNFPSTNFLSSSTATGFNAGLSLSWNLFDGGQSIINVKNAQIQLENQNYYQEQLQQEVQRNLLNANGNYTNRKKIFEIQRQNVATAKANFDRSNERFRLGQISSLELRQAQINLLNARTQKNSAKYQAKLAELELLQLTGKLLEIEF